MTEYNLLQTPIDIETEKDVLEKIVGFLQHPNGFFHIVSLNPEIMVIAEENSAFKSLICDANVRIIDGVGVYVACKILGIPVKERITGVDFMNSLLTKVPVRGLRVLFLGGKDSVAATVAECYQKKYPEGYFKGIKGIENINKPTAAEEKNIKSFLLDFRPHILFVAFGSPAQELWLWEHRELLGGVVAMGVGQGLDVYSGSVQRANPILRKIGLEWLFRLITQPWRWKRQMRLITFIQLVMKEKQKQNESKKDKIEALEK